MHVVTLSQPATDSQLLALAYTWPTLASNEALLTVDLPQAARHVRYSHRFTNSTTRGGSGAQEPRATMSYPSSNLHRQPSSSMTVLVVRHVIYLRLQRCERRARSSPADAIPVPSPVHPTCPNRGASRYLLRREEVVPKYRTRCAITRCREIMMPHLSI